MRRPDSNAQFAADALAGSAMRRHGRTFFIASLLLGRRRGAVEALYRLCRHIDDVADGDGPVAQRRAELQALELGVQRADLTLPFVRLALALRDRHGLPLAGLRRLIEEAQGEFDFVRPADADALLRYAFGVAGAVGWMLCPLLGARDRMRATPSAVALGIAMQLTNIARDVMADARLGRVYLPQSLAPQVTAQALIDGDAAAMRQAHAAALQLLRQAEGFYALAEQGLRWLPVPPRWSVRAASRLYRDIGREVVALGIEGLPQRAVVGPWRKGALLAGLAVGRSPRFEGPALERLPAVLEHELARLEAA
jgi:phytoene synthase